MLRNFGRSLDLRWRFGPLASALLILGCGSAPLRTKAPPTEADREPAPKVEPVPELPRVRDAAIGTDGAVTLRTPVAREAARALIQRIFEAFHARSMTELEAEIDESTLVLGLNPGSDREMVRGLFIMTMDQQLRNAPYDQLEVESMYRAQDIEIYAPDELGIPGRPGRIASMKSEDVLVRVPIATPRVGADVLFREEMRFLLRRDGSKYRLRGMTDLATR